MKKTKRIGLLGFISLFVASLLTATSFGYWTLSSNTSVEIKENTANTETNVNEYTTDRAVCYIDNANSVFYTSIEKALKIATSGRTVYVVPGTNPTIRNDCEIKSGVTLCLPYEGTSATTDRKNTDMGDFADSTAANVTANRKNLVTLSAGKTITNNGTLIVGGIVGIQSNVPSGHTGTSYTELLLDDGASIINNGTITLHGYIKETKTNNGSSIIHNSGAKMTEPLVIYDYKGGTYSKACYSAKIMPFSIYDLPNCQVYQTFNHGSYLIGMITLYIPTGSIWAVSEANILAPDTQTALFKQTSGSVSIKYTPADCRYTTNDAKSSTQESKANITYIYSDGNISLSSLIFNMPIIGAVDSKDYDCPICYKFRITIESGGLNIDNRMKFMGGSEVFIGENGTVTINSSIIFYQNYIPAITYTTNVYPSVFHTAKLTNNGSLVLNGSFGGLIETSRADSTLTTSSTFSASYSTTEALNVSGNSVSSSVSESDVHQETALAYIDENSMPSSPITIPSAKSYKSQGTFWSEGITDITGIIVELVSGSAESDKGKAGEFKLKATILPNNHGSVITGYLWESNPSTNCSFNTNNTPEVTFTTAANGSDTDIPYFVTCTVYYTTINKESKSLTSPQFQVTAQGSCITEDTLVMLEDGSYKKAIDIRAGDMLMTINHETGKFEAAPVVFNDDYDKEASNYNVVTLEFSNGKSVEIIYEHGFFDLDTMKYEYITENNYNSFIGHRFVTTDYVNGTLTKGEATLVNAYVSKQHIRICSPVTYKNLNIITEGMLSMPGGISGIFNIFEYDDDLSYNAEKKQQDIETYGLFDYSHFEDRIPYEFYEAFNGQYLKVAIGKGILTEEMIDYYINRYLPIVGDQNSSE